MSLSPPPSREKLPVTTEGGRTVAEMPRAWLKWFSEIKELLAPVSTAGMLLWGQVSKAGSNLTEIITRNHDDLQNLNTSSHTHLTALNHTDLTDGGSTILHKHDHATQDNLNSTTYWHSTYEEYHSTIVALGTSIGSGCTLSINADNTKFDIAAGHLHFTDGYTDPLTPVLTNVSYAGSTANVVTNLATQDSSYISIDKNGTIYQTASKPVAADTRDKILLGALVHTNRTSITSADSTTNVIGLAISNSLSDISTAVGIINEGNQYSGNVTNTLRLNKSAGYFWQIGINWKNDKKNPNRITAPASTGSTHLATWRNGSGGWTTLPKTDIIPGSYDDGTGGATTPSGVLATNKWQIIKIYYLPNSQLTGIEYGQVVYNNEADAEAAKSVSTNDNPALASLPFRGWLLVRGGATDLNNTGDAIFIDAGKFGQLTSGAGTGSSTTTLQGAYDNSTQPQIVTSSSGSVQVKRGSAADTDSVFEVLNGAGTAVLSVTGERATLTSPALGTPQSGTLTNCTGLPIAGGGTGQTTATAAFDALAPTTTQGDIIYHNGTDNVRLAKGTASQVLAMNAGATAPEWVAPASGSIPDLSLTCTQATGALTFAGVSHLQTFRSATLTDGTVSTITADPADLVLPSGGTLGFVTTVQGRIVVAEMNNGGTSEYAICNIAGGLQMDETNLISTTAIDTASDAANVWYSTTARTNLPYKIVCAVDVVNTAGAWGNPVLVQAAGGQSLFLPAQAVTHATLDSTSTGVTQAVGTNNTSLATTAFCEAGFVNNDIGVNGIGCIRLARLVSPSGAIASGATVAGSLLNGGYSNGASVVDDGLLTGTWRNIGNTSMANFVDYKLTQRIA